MSKGKKKQVMSDHDIIEMLREKLERWRLFLISFKLFIKGARLGIVLWLLGEVSSRGMIRDSDSLLSMRDTQMRHPERKMRLINRYEPFIARALREAIVNLIVIRFCVAFSAAKAFAEGELQCSACGKFSLSRE